MDYVKIPKKSIVVYAIIMGILGVAASLLSQNLAVIIVSSTLLCIIVLIAPQE